MHWKKFRLLPKSEKSDESYFILGVDIGNDSSAIAFYDVLRGNAEVIDISGGYGRPTVPTVMQYIRDTKEWVFGEYAVLNRGQGQEVTLGSLTEKLGRGEYLDIDGRPVSAVHVLGLFLREIISGVRNINPKAEIAGIVAAVPSYLSQEAGEELVRAFGEAGYEKELICLVPERECVFADYFRREPPADRKILLLDYGSREMRGGLYSVRVRPNGQAGGQADGQANGQADGQANGQANGQADGQAGGQDGGQAGGQAEGSAETKAAAAEITSLSSLFSEELGTRRVDEALTGMLLADFPQKLTPRLEDQFSAFLYQHKDLLFQKNSRPAKLYMNFVYPPAQVTVTKARIDALMGPFRALFVSFVQNALEKNIYGGGPERAEDVSRVLCSGGGFEMPWTKDALAEIFPAAKIYARKNSKSAAAEGAALIAASRLGAADGVPAVTIEDLHQIPADIGIFARLDGKERFMPLVERNSFWWQKPAKRMFIVNEPVGGAMAEDRYLELCSRSAGGDVARLALVTLDGFPERPKGAARLDLSVEFESGREMRLTVEDGGFGELFPKSGYRKTVSVAI